MTRKLTVDNGFTPCPVADGDELFPNGIFKFNISKMFEVMETSDNAKLFEGHTQASILCMDTKGHGLKLTPSEDLSLPLVRCITDTYETFQQKSRAK